MLHRHVRSANRSTAASTLNLSMMAGAASASFLVGGFARSAAIAVAVAAAVAAAALVVLPPTAEENDADPPSDPRVAAGKVGAPPLDPSVVS